AGVARAQHRGNGLRDDRNLARPRPAFEILAIVLDALVVARAGAAADLPQPCDPRADQQIITAIAAVAIKLRARDRTRADEAHVAAQHVEQLRQLVEARLAQERANLGYPRINAQLLTLAPLRRRIWIRRENVGETLLAVDRHRAKLEALEASALAP